MSMVDCRTHALAPISTPGTTAKHLYHHVIQIPARTMEIAQMYLAVSHTHAPALKDTKEVTVKHLCLPVQHPPARMEAHALISMVG